MKDSKVCVIGLGFVGLTLACALGRAGYEVHGVEKRPEIVEMIRAGVPHFHEPGLQQELRRCLDHGKLQVYGTIAAVPPADVYIITVGTPLHSLRNEVRLDMIDEAAADVAAHMHGHPLVILRSTVKIGVTRAIAGRLISGDKWADVAFCPERTLEGKALEELTTLPQIVGGMNAIAVERAAAFFGAITPTIVRVSSPEAAEMVKLVSNAHRDVLFGYVNELATVCTSQGLDAMEIVRAGNLGYPRVNLPRPGPAGGPCLTKDSYILNESCAPNGLPITVSARHTNESVPTRAADHVEMAVERRGIAVRRIAFAGFAFKGRPETDDLRGSPAFDIVDAINRRFPEAEVVGWDPIVPPSVLEPTFHVKAYAQWQNACAAADLVVLMNEHPALATLSLVEVAKGMAKPGLIYDFWHQHKLWPSEPGHGVSYLAFGMADVAFGEKA